MHINLIKSRLREFLQTIIETEYSLRKYKKTHIEVNPEAEYNNDIRINVVVPNLSNVYGGISTALCIVREICSKLNCEVRLLSLGTLNKEIAQDYFDGLCHTELVASGDSCIKIRPKDIFIATFWTTALVCKKFIDYQNKIFTNDHKLVYLIQDFEPGFYRWTTEYAEAESTYMDGEEIIAIFNSYELMTFFKNRGYKFYLATFFNPQMNTELKKYLMQLHNDYIRKRKQIIIYGRPTIHRNAFSLVVNSLKVFGDLIGKEEAKKWVIYSVGKKHRNIRFNNGICIKSLGKLTLKNYAQIMLESNIGISLMVSPHPSYPPLEMSSFGVKTITNCFENKNLSYFNKNIYCIRNYGAEDIAKQILELSYDCTENRIDVDTGYIREDGFMETTDWIIKNYIDKYR